MDRSEKVIVLDGLVTDASVAARRFGENDSIVQYIMKNVKGIRQSVATSVPITAKVFTNVRDKNRENGKGFEFVD